MKLHEKIYNYGSIVFWILYIVTIIGIGQNSPHYLNEVHELFKIFISVVLMYLFNPWNSATMTPFHKKLVFEGAFMLLLSSSVKNLFGKIPGLKKFIP